MVDFVLPPNACFTRLPEVAPVSNTSLSRSLFTGQALSVGRDGDRLRYSFNVRNANNAQAYATRAALQALKPSLRGSANRIWIFDPSYVQRGSFPSAEVLTNNTFSNGTSGWSATDSVLSVVDRVMRATSTGTSQDFGFYRSSTAVTQYAPYLLRAGYKEGRLSTPIYRVVVDSDYATGGNEQSTPGIVQGRIVTGASIAVVNFYQNGASGESAGNYIEVVYVSLARCALIDNGQNYLLQSDALGTSWTPTRSTVTSNSIAAPDGTTTADTLNEDGTAANTHYVTQTVTVASAAADFAYTHSVKAGTRTWVCLALFEGTGSHEARAFVNLSTGAVGTVTTTGANMTNARAFVVDQGGGWYAITIVARKTNAATGLAPILYIAEGDNDITFSGLSAASLYAWRGTLAQSSVPTRQFGTTSAAFTSGTAQTGRTIRIKGLPVSTNGLLLAGDRVQIGNQTCILSASLNSDSAGRGYLELSTPVHVSTTDSAPVIVNMPMSLCRMMDNANGWSERPGGFSDVDFTFEECCE